MDKTLKIVKLSDSAVKTFMWATEMKRFPGELRYIAFKENGDKLMLTEEDLLWIYGPFDYIQGIMKVTLN